MAQSSFQSGVTCSQNSRRYYIPTKAVLEKAVQFIETATQQKRLAGADIAKKPWKPPVNQRLCKEDLHEKPVAQTHQAAAMTGTAP
jgi:hypothetical protein